MSCWSSMPKTRTWTSVARDLFRADVKTRTLYILIRDTKRRRDKRGAALGAQPICRRARLAGPRESSALIGARATPTGLAEPRALMAATATDFLIYIHIQTTAFVCRYTTT